MRRARNLLHFLGFCKVLLVGIFDSAVGVVYCADRIARFWKETAGSVYAEGFWANEASVSEVNGFLLASAVIGFPISAVRTNDEMGVRPIGEAAKESIPTLPWPTLRGPGTEQAIHEFSSPSRLESLNWRPVVTHRVTREPVSRWVLAS